MSLQFNAPLNIKIRDGIRVNIALSVSHAIERGLVQKQIKEDIQKLIREGKLERQLIEDDYIEGEKLDTVSFWFIGGTSLAYRVGHEITKEDFDRIAGQLESLEFRSQRDRIPSHKQTNKAT